MSFEEFQDGHHGGHFGYQNGTILAILNLWLLKMNDFNNFESLSHCEASHQVSTKLDLPFGRRCRLKNFMMAAMAAILAIGTERF